MIQKVKSFFKAIISSGTDKDYQEEELIRIRLTNIIALIAIVFCASYNLIYWYFSFYILFTINLLAILIYSFIPYISSKNIHLSKLMLYFTLVINVFLASSFFGSNAQIHLLLFPISLLPFLLINIKNRTEITLHLFFAFMAIFVLYITDFSLLYNNNLNNTFVTFLDLCNKVFTILGSIIILYLFIKSGEKSKERLTSINESLEIQLKAIFDNSFDAIIFVNKNTGKIIQANKKSLQYFDLEKNNHLYTFAKNYLADEQIAISDFININTRLELNGEWQSEARFVLIDKSIIWGAISIKNILFNNSSSLLIRITDVTEKKQIELKLKESEEKYHGIFNATPDLVFLLGIENGRFIFEDNNLIHQEFFTPYFGVFKGRYIDEILPPELSAFPISKYNECFNKGKTIKYEEEINLPDGLNLWFYTILTPFKNKAVNTIKILGSSRDITAFKHAEQNLLNALKEKEVLLSEIHHRVKNNLAVVSGLLMLQSEKVKNPEDFNLFEESRNRIHSMALIHEKLYRNDDFSSIGFTEYLNDLVENIKHSYTLNKDVLVKVNTDNITLQIGVALPLGLLVNEIITNSFKHAFNLVPSPELNILLKGSKDSFELIVKDNGPGFDYDKLKDNNQTLGASLINSLAEQINAEVDYSFDKGAKFSIRFKAL